MVREIGVSAVKRGRNYNSVDAECFYRRPKLLLLAPLTLVRKRNVRSIRKSASRSIQSDLFEAKSKSSDLGTSKRRHYTFDKAL